MCNPSRRGGGRVTLESELQKDDAPGEKGGGGWMLIFTCILCSSSPSLQDNPDLFAMMEKTRMYIFRGSDPEVYIYALPCGPLWSLGVM